MTPFRILTIAAVLGLTISGCKKYDENEHFLHLRTPEARLTGSWNSTQIMATDTALTTASDFFSPDGQMMTATFDRSGSVTFDQDAQMRSFEGTWTFNDDKSVLHIGELSSNMTEDSVMLDLYWDIIALESGNFKAIHFREFNGVDISSQQFELRFSKQD